MANAESLKAILAANKDENQQLTPALHGATSAEQVDRLARQALAAAPILAVRENRVRAQQARHRLLEQVREERAAEMAVCENCRRPETGHPWEEMVDSVNKDGLPVVVRTGCDQFRLVPGGQTGLIVRKFKATGVEYALDTGLLAEYREHEKQIAIEMGQWQEGVQPGAVSIQIVCPAPTDSDQTPRVSFASTDTLELPSADEEDAGISEIALRPE